MLLDDKPRGYVALDEAATLRLKVEARDREIRELKALIVLLRAEVERLGNPKG